MKLFKTAIILIFSAILVTGIALQGVDLTLTQWEVLRKIFVVVVVISLLCFLAGEWTGNLSQVDKLWSITPILYSWYFAVQSNFDPRLVLMAGLVTLWGIRLTYNFYRRGGYSLLPWRGEEDYRWKVLRQSPIFQRKFLLTLFNFFFISFYQTFLIFSFTLPSLAAMTDAPPLYFLDFLIALAFLAFLVIETIADQQQFVFQNQKQEMIQKEETLSGDYKNGFISSGLWGVVRHPNYASEQAIWICYYLFSVVATGEWLNGSVIGCFLLILLFQGSCNFSESISSRKYLAYQSYIRRVPRFIPNPFRKK